jgi:hypothetical protein
VGTGRQPFPYLFTLQQSLTGGHRGIDSRQRVFLSCQKCESILDVSAADGPDDQVSIDHSESKRACTIWAGFNANERGKLYRHLELSLEWFSPECKCNSF